MYRLWGWGGRGGGGSVKIECEHMFLYKPVAPAALAAAAAVEALREAAAAAAAADCAPGVPACAHICISTILHNHDPTFLDQLQPWSFLGCVASHSQEFTSTDQG